MKTETIYLREDDNSIKLQTFIHDDSMGVHGCKRPAIIVCAGGAYQFLADNREGEPVALKYFSEGYNAFMLDYSIGESAKFPRPVVEVSRAIVYVRRNADILNVDANRIYVIGFSAGGHLAASIGTFWHEDWAKAYDDMEYGENKPTAVITSYPVITSEGLYMHHETFCNVTGEKEPTIEQFAMYSVEKHISEKTVPTFIWHTVEDTSVPVENALLYAMELNRKKVPYELHIYPKGNHGLALANKETWYGNPVLDDPHVATWFRDSIEFLEIFKGEEEAK